MYRIASRRVEKAGLSAKVNLRRGDAVQLPFEDDFFDAIFMSFTLELFDTPEIPIVLQECCRVLRNGHPMVVVSMSKKDEESVAVKLYEWAHAMFPNYLDCRPIYVIQALEDAGFRVSEQIEMKLWGLPIDAVLAKKI
jgi:demethylmenaquinone methyltransferase/2-methoxy-6-polyprenyl-1,4-benzoquinol methylase